MKFILKDLQRMGSPVIGHIEITAEYGPVEIANLLRSGWLHFETEMSEADLKAIAAEQAKNESSLDAIQKQIDAEATKLPERDYSLEELSARQLKGLCEQRGLATNGNKFDLIDRLQNAPVEVKPAKKKAKA
jgi:hypothetical protein